MSDEQPAISDEDSLMFGEILAELGLLGGDRGVYLDTEKLKQCPFCDYRHEPPNLDIMTGHMKRYHEDAMTDEEALKQVMRILREQEES